MAITLAELNVLLTASTKGFDRELNRATKKMDDFAATARRAAAKATVALAGIATAGGYLLKVASDAEELDNVIQQSFGSMAKEVNQWARDTARAMGRSAEDMRRFVGVSMAMLKPMLKNEQAAAKMSKQIAQLSADFASFWNVTDQEAFNALRAGLVGETEPLRRFGINLNEASLESFRLAEGIETSVQEMDEAQKVMLRYRYILQASRDVQGDAARTADSFANVMRSIRSEVHDAAVELGRMLLPAATDLAIIVRDAVRAFRDLDDATKAQVVRWGLIAGAVLGAVAAFGVLASAVALGVKAFGVMASAVAFLVAPTTIGFAILIGGAVALYKAWDENWGGIQEKTQAVWDALEPILNVVDEWAGRVVTTAWEWTIGALNTLDWLYHDFVPWLQDLPGEFRTAWSFAVEYGVKLTADAKATVQGWADTIQGWVTTAIEYAVALKKDATTVVAGWAEDLQSAATQVIKWAVGLKETAADTIASWASSLQGAVNTAIKFGVALVEDAQTTVQGWLDTIQGWVTGAVAYAVDLADNAQQTVAGWLDTVQDWVPGAVRFAIDLAADAEQVVSSWLSTIQNWATGAVTYAVDLANDAQQTVQGWAKTIQGWVTGAVQIAVELGSDTSQAVRNLLSGAVEVTAKLVDFVRGASSQAVQWLMNAVSGTAEAATIAVELRPEIPEGAENLRWGDRLQTAVNRWLERLTWAEISEEQYSRLRKRLEEQGQNVSQFLKQEGDKYFKRETFALELAFDITKGAVIWVAGTFAVNTFQQIIKTLTTTFPKVFLGQHGALAFKAALGLNFAISLGEVASEELDLPLFKSKLWEAFGSWFKAAGTAAVVAGVALGGSPFWLTVGVGLALVLASVEWGEMQKNLAEKIGLSEVEATLYAEQVQLQKRFSDLAETRVIARGSLDFSKMEQLNAAMTTLRNLMETRPKPGMRELLADLEEFQKKLHDLSETAEEALSVEEIIQQLANSNVMLKKAIEGQFDMPLADFMKKLAWAESGFENVGNAASSAQGEFQLLASTREAIEDIFGPVNWDDPMQRIQAAFHWLQLGLTKDINIINQAVDRLNITFEEALRLWWVVGGPRLRTIRMSDVATMGVTVDELLERWREMPEPEGKLSKGAILPGYGGGDKILALLEAGEAVVPKEAVRGGWPGVLAWFKKHGVPGFKEGLPPSTGNPALDRQIANTSGWIDQMSGVIDELGDTMKKGFTKLFEFLGDLLTGLLTKVVGEEQAQEIIDFWGDMKSRLGSLFDAGAAAQGAAEATRTPLGETQEQAMGRIGWSKALMKVLREDRPWAFLRRQLIDTGQAIKQGLGHLAAGIEARSGPLFDSFEDMKNALGHATLAAWDFGKNLAAGLGQMIYANAPVMQSAVQGAQAGMAAGPAGAALGAGLAFLAESEQFGELIGAVNGYLQIFADAIGMATEPLMPLVGIIGEMLAPWFEVLGTILQTLIIPVMKLLFPPLKWFGVLLAMVGSAIVGFIEIIVRGISAVFNALAGVPGIGGAFKGLANATKNLADGLGKSRETLTRSAKDLASMTMEEANAKAKAVAATEKFTETLTNVPQGFKVALARFNATQVSSPRIPSAQTGGYVTKTGLVNVHAGEVIKPADSSGGGQIIIQHMVVQTNDPEEFMRKLERLQRKGNNRSYGTPVNPAPQFS